jgi:septal ring factor EnvC (AmiA/AmiB activator)
MDIFKKLRLWLNGENLPATNSSCAEIIDGHHYIASYYVYLIGKREETIKELDILIQEREKNIEELDTLIQEVHENVKKLVPKLQAHDSRSKNDTGESDHLMGPQRGGKLNCAEEAVRALRSNKRKRKAEPPTQETKNGTREGDHLMGPQRGGNLNCAEVAAPAVKRRRV